MNLGKHYPHSIDFYTAMIRYKMFGVRCRGYIWISLISLLESEIVILLLYSYMKNCSKGFNLSLFTSFCYRCLITNGNQ